MTAKKNTDPAEDDSLGVLDDAASLDTTGIGILGGTAQVNVAIPTGDDDDLVDDSVIDGEVVSDLIIDEVEGSSGVGRIDDEAFDIVIELPADELPEALPTPAAPRDSAEDVEQAGPATAASADPAPVTAEIVEQPESSPEPEPEPVVVPPSKSAPKPAAAKAKAKAKTEPAAAAAPAPVPEPVAENALAAAGDAAGTAPSEPADVSGSSWADALQKAANGSAAASAPESPESASDAEAGDVPEPVPTPEPARAADQAAPRAKADTHAALAPKPVAAPAEVELASRRIDDQRGQASRESADLLTADRLLDPHQLTKPEPEGAWSHFLYTVSGRRINIGDGKKAKARKALTARIAGSLPGGARFVPVLSRKGGVGKTTVTALLGMALADARDDRVIAVDANPDRGTLAARIVGAHGKSVRDLVRARGEVRGYHDLSAIVARDVTRLDVLASDADPRIADAFGDADYRDVADVAAHYYSLVLTDTGTGIVHSVMGATLDLADQLVIVSGLSVDEARLASETLTWLEANGYAEQARRAIVVLNQSTPGSPLVRLTELETHFATRAGHVIRIPYDAQIAGGGPIVFAALQPETRNAARELAALLVEGLRADAA
ncbi:MinD/ParA family ATP-binding protein [Microbacterium sp. NPDC055903]